VSPLRQLRGVLRGKERVEVGGVVKQRFQTHSPFFHQSPREIFFDPRQLGSVQSVQVIPEALTAQSGPGQRKQPDQDGIPIPGGELAFAGGGQGAVQGGEKQVLAHRRSLLSFGGLGVDGAQQVQLPSQVPEGRSGTEIPLFSAQGSSRSLGEELEEFVGGAEMAQDAEARMAVLIAIGLDEAPVVVAAHGVGLEAWHDSYIQNCLCYCQGGSQ